MSNDLHFAGTKTPVPRPSGPFSVARTCREWIDPDRAEIYSDYPAIDGSWWPGSGTRPALLPALSGPRTFPRLGRRLLNCWE